MASPRPAVLCALALLLGTPAVRAEEQPAVRADEEETGRPVTGLSNYTRFQPIIVQDALPLPGALGQAAVINRTIESEPGLLLRPSFTYGFGHTFELEADLQAGLANDTAPVGPLGFGARVRLFGPNGALPAVALATSLVTPTRVAGVSTLFTGLVTENLGLLRLNFNLGYAARRKTADLAVAGLGLQRPFGRRLLALADVTAERDTGTPVAFGGDAGLEVLLARRYTVFATGGFQQDVGVRVLGGVARSFGGP